MEIRRSYDRLISTMGFPILVRRHLYIESGPRKRSGDQYPFAFFVIHCSDITWVSSCLKSLITQLIVQMFVQDGNKEVMQKVFPACRDIIMSVSLTTGNGNNVNIIFRPTSHQQLPLNHLCYAKFPYSTWSSVISAAQLLSHGNR